MFVYDLLWEVLKIPSADPCFRTTPGGIGYSFQLAITAPRMDLIGYGIATAQSCCLGYIIGHRSMLSSYEMGVYKVYQPLLIIKRHVSTLVPLKLYIYTTNRPIVLIHPLKIYSVAISNCLGESSQ